MAEYNSLYSGTLPGLGSSNQITDWQGIDDWSAWQGGTSFDENRPLFTSTENPDVTQRGSMVSAPADSLGMFNWVAQVNPFTGLRENAQLLPGSYSAGSYNRYAAANPDTGLPAPTLTDSSGYWDLGDYVLSYNQLPPNYEDKWQEAVVEENGFPLRQAGWYSPQGLLVSTDPNYAASTYADQDNPFNRLTYAAKPVDDSSFLGDIAPMLAIAAMMYGIPVAGLGETAGAALGAEATAGDIIAAALAEGAAPSWMTGYEALAGAGELAGAEGALASMTPSSAATTFQTPGFLETAQIANAEASALGLTPAESAALSAGTSSPAGYLGGYLTPENLASSLLQNTGKEALTSAATGQDFNPTDVLSGMGSGALGGFTGNVTSSALDASGDVPQWLNNTLTSGATSGVNTALSGGDPLAGFLSGTLSPLANAGAQTLAQNGLDPTLSSILASGTLGGVKTGLAGGDPLTGFLSGATASGVQQGSEYLTDGAMPDSLARALGQASGSLVGGNSLEGAIGSAGAGLLGGLLNGGLSGLSGLFGGLSSGDTYDLDEGSFDADSNFDLEDALDVSGDSGVSDIEQDLIDEGALEGYGDTDVIDFDTYVPDGTEDSGVLTLPEDFGYEWEQGYPESDDTLTLPDDFVDNPYNPEQTAEDVISEVTDNFTDDITSDDGDISDIEQDLIDEGALEGYDDVDVTDLGGEDISGIEQDLIDEGALEGYEDTDVTDLGEGEDISDIEQELIDEGALEDYGDTDVIDVGVTPPPVVTPPPTTQPPPVVAPPPTTRPPTSGGSSADWLSMLGLLGLLDRGDQQPQVIQSSPDVVQPVYQFAASPDEFREKMFGRRTPVRKYSDGGEVFSGDLNLPDDFGYEWQTDYSSDDDPLVLPPDFGYEWEQSYDGSTPPVTVGGDSDGGSSNPLSGMGSFLRSILGGGNDGRTGYDGALAGALTALARQYYQNRNAQASQAALSRTQQRSPYFTAGVTPSGSLGTATRRQGVVRAARGGATYFSGGSPGQADNRPAMVSDGEYVLDADVVSALGDGNNAAGAGALDRMRENIRAHKRSAPANKIPPKAKRPEQYLKGKKHG